MTGLPSALIHRISGRGLPVAAHSTTVPVVLEKSIRLDGSFKKTGPDSDDELAAAVAEPSPTHAPINQIDEIIIIIAVIIIIWRFSNFQKIVLKHLNWKLI